MDLIENQWKNVDTDYYDEWNCASKRTIFKEFRNRFGYLTRYIFDVVEGSKKYSVNNKTEKSIKWKNRKKCIDFYIKKKGS